MIWGYRSVIKYFTSMLQSPDCILASAKMYQTNMYLLKIIIL